MLGEGYIHHGSIMPLFIGCAWTCMVGGILAFILATLYFALHPAVARNRL
jgi:hypothetical protein